MKFGLTVDVGQAAQNTKAAGRPPPCIAKPVVVRPEIHTLPALTSDTLAAAQQVAATAMP